MSIELFIFSSLCHIVNGGLKSAFYRIFFLIHLSIVSIPKLLDKRNYYFSVFFFFFGPVDKHYGSVCFVMLFVYVIISDGYISSIFNSLGMMCFNRVHITLAVFSLLIPTVTPYSWFPAGWTLYCK